MNSHSLQPIDFDSVADLYDSYVRTDFDMPFWLLEAKSISGKVLELACGTGRVSLHLLKAGIDLSCVDYAPQMLAQFHRKLQESRLSCSSHCQDMAELNLSDRFDLIIIPFHSFSEIVDRRKQKLALRQIRAHLTEHGTFICTLQNPAVRTATMDGKTRPIGEFPMHDGNTLSMSTRLNFDAASGIASGEQIYERFSSDKVLLDRRSLEIHFHLFSKSEFEELLSECGFIVKTLYGDYERRPFQESTSPFLIWKVGKQATDEPE